MSDYADLEVIRALRDRIYWYDPNDELYLTATFCDVEDLIRCQIENTRVLVHAGKQAGLSTRSLVEYYDQPGAKLPIDADYARIKGHFAAAERAIRLGAQAGQQMIEDAYEYANNSIAALTPWLRDVEAVDDDD